MPQAVWVGDLSFGLVNIPVKLYGATSPKTVRFHHYEAGTGRRIRYRRVAEGPGPDLASPSADDIDSEPSPPAAAAERPSEAPSRDAPRDSGDDVEVPWDDIVRGVEVEPGRVVTVERDELESLAPERSRVLEVEQFVDLAAIDPVYFEKSYYVVPQPGIGAERPYWLLYRTMEAAARVAVGRFVLRTKEYLAAVRPAEHVLMLETLFYADEVRDPKEVWRPFVDEPPKEEVRVANQFIDALAGQWDPARHRDEYRDRLLDLLHDKTGEAIAVAEPDEEAAAPPVTDLMEALKESVAAARRARADDQRARGGHSSTG